MGLARGTGAGLAVWMNGERVGTWGALPAGEAGVFGSKRRRAGWAQASSRPSVVVRLPRAWVTKRPGRALAVESWFEESAADSQRDSPARSATLSGRQLQRLSILASPQWAADCAGAVAVLPLDEEPKRADRMRGDPASEQEIGQVLRGVRSPHACLDSSRPQQAEEPAALRGLGLKRRRPCSTTHAVQACDGNGGQRRFLPGHRNPGQKRNTKPRWTLGLVGDQVLSGPYPQLAEDLRTFFWASANGPAC